MHKHDLVGVAVQRVPHHVIDGGLNMFFLKCPRVRKEEEGGHSMLESANTSFIEVTGVWSTLPPHQWDHWPRVAFP